VLTGVPGPLLCIVEVVVVTTTGVGQVVVRRAVCTSTSNRAGLVYIEASRLVQRRWLGRLQRTWRYIYHHTHDATSIHVSTAQLKTILWSQPQGVIRFITAHQHNSAIQCYSRWYRLENTGQKTK